MKNKTCLLQAIKAGSVAGALALGTLLAPTARAQVNVGVNIPVPQVNVSVAPDDYTYYPSYGVYYSPKRHLYGWKHGDAWSWQAKPPVASADVVLASPAVRMDFHDSPEHHHADIVKRYPKDWHPEPVRHEERHEERR